MASKTMIIQREKLREALKMKRPMPYSRWRRTMRRNNALSEVADKQTDRRVRRYLARKDESLE